MSYIFKKGATSQSVELYIVDSTDGTPETGVLWNTAGIDLKYRRKDAAVVSITEAALTSPALTDTWESGGFLEIGNGVYRLDLPDAALASASGIDRVVVFGTVTGMVVLPVTIHLTDFDLNDAVRGGLTALPNANADAAGGLPISDAGGLNLDTQLATTDQIGAAGVGLAEAGGNGDHLTAINLPNQTMNITGNITGNLSGTVGSVTGAVGSVTGAIGSVGAGGITAASLGADCITNAKIADNALAAEQFAADCITNAKIADDAIAAENFATNAIATDAVAATALDKVVMSDLATGAPSSTANIVTAINYLYEVLRNKTTTTATLVTIKKDDGSTDLMKSTISDDATTFTKGEFVSG